jgi:hypothetical protein
VSRPRTRPFGGFWKRLE